MTWRSHQYSRDQRGFTLIEVLVVILLVGILAAIAIPSLLTQRSKANDSAAKVLARTAETAAEAYSTDHSGTYKALTITELQAIESTLKEKKAAELLAAEPMASGGYMVESKSVATGDTFKIERTASGETARICTKANTGGCPLGGSW